MSKSIVHVAGAVFILCAASGCIGLAMGGDDHDSRYSNGRMTENVNAPIERAYSATIATLQSRKLPVTSKQVNASAAHIKSKYSDGTEVQIDIASVTSAVSEIRVRVGAGDRSRSTELLNEIKAGL